jgi:lipid II:glycine glycyltransferase (peptidoglycan interpeptide bridge formation enzyme)
MPERTPIEWNKWLTQYPDAHLLQSCAWGELKTAFGWERSIVTTGPVGAQILFRKLPGGLKIGYIPKGPVGPVDPSAWSALWAEVDVLCRRKHAFFLKIEPDEWEQENHALSTAMQGMQAGAPGIQPRRTVVIDLNGGETAWMERMKQKTRYNIRLAQKKDIVVRESGDFAAFHQMALQTGERDGFNVHSLEYYQKSYDLFHPSGEGTLLGAYYQDRMLAGLILFAQGKRAWYLHGASSNEERNRMPTYLLQWEAMRWAAAKGCSEYDLWGIPDEDEATLEANFETRNDGLWGVYRFKRGFGGRIFRSAGAWDRVYQPGLYRLYRWWLNRKKGSEAGSS